MSVSGSSPLGSFSGSSPLGSRTVLLVVGLGTFMSALDGSAVNAVLPVIRISFDCSVSAVEWAITTYLLVISALLLTAGRLGDLRGHRTVYLWGMFAFGVASLLCAAAPSVGHLVAARGLQGLGAALMFANGPALLVRSYPVRERGRVLGLLATMTYLGLTAGPSVGGWVAEGTGWRWVFLLNLPLGLLVLTIGRVALPRGEPGIRRSFDRAGAILFAAGLTGLLLVLNQAPSWGWTSRTTLATALGTVLLLGVFLRVESRHADPMLDLKLFRNRTFASAVAGACLHYVAIFSVTFLVPFCLIQGWGLTPGRAGSVLSTQPLVMAVTAPLSGALSDRIGSRIPVVTGMLILAVGLVLLAAAAPGGAILPVIGALMVVGLGTGTFVSPNSSALFGSVPSGRQGIAGGVMAAARNVGMVVGVALAGAVLTSRLHAGGSLIEGAAEGLTVAAAVAVVGAVVTAAREGRVG